MYLGTLLNVEPGSWANYPDLAFILPLALPEELPEPLTWPPAPAKLPRYQVLR
jgi:hypothetical protein